MRAALKCQLCWRTSRCPGISSLHTCTGNGNAGATWATTANSSPLFSMHVNFEGPMPDNVVRFHQFHRWLNPFANQRATMATPMEPNEIEERLQPGYAHYHWRQIHDCESLKPAGFSLGLVGVRSGKLVVGYGRLGANTRLDMELRTSIGTKFMWFVYLVCWPTIIVALAIHLGEWVLSSPTRSLWVDGAQYYWEQPLFVLLGVIAGIAAVAGHLESSWRRRSEINTYRRFLANTIKARSIERAP